MHTPSSATKTQIAATKLQPLSVSTQPDSSWSVTARGLPQSQLTPVSCRSNRCDTNTCCTPLHSSSACLTIRPPLFFRGICPCSVDPSALLLYCWASSSRVLHPLRHRRRQSRRRSGRNWQPAAPTASYVCGTLPTARRSACCGSFRRRRRACREANTDVRMSDEQRARCQEPFTAKKRSLAPGP
jgi:hypothetical protein